MKQETKHKMEVATKNLFRPTSTCLKNQYSTLVEVRVNFGTKSLLGEVKYEHQRRLLCPKDTSLQQIKVNMLRKIEQLGPKQKKDASYHMFFRNKMVSAGKHETVGDLIKINSSADNLQNKVQITFLSMETFG